SGLGLGTATHRGGCHAVTKPTTAGGLAGTGYCQYWSATVPGELQWNGPVHTPAANSAFRLAQVHNRYSVPTQLHEALSNAPQGPILLVDDIASTRWSLTVASATLLQAGADGVLPLTLGMV